MQQKDYFLKRLETFLLFLQKLLNKEYSDIEIIKSDLLEMDVEEKLINFIVDDSIENVNLIFENVDERILKAILEHFLLNDEINREKVLYLIDYYQKISQTFDAEFNARIKKYKDEK